MASNLTLSPQQVSFIKENATKMRQCEIAEALNISKNKVYHHRKQALKELQGDSGPSQLFKVELKTPEHTWLI